MDEPPQQLSRGFLPDRNVLQLPTDRNSKFPPGDCDLFQQHALHDPLWGEVIFEFSSQSLEFLRLIFTEECKLLCKQPMFRRVVLCRRSILWPRGFPSVMAVCRNHFL